jgi:hypothetical protein
MKARSTIIAKANTAHAVAMVRARSEGAGYAISSGASSSVVNTSYRNERSEENNGWRVAGTTTHISTQSAI